MQPRLVWAILLAATAGTVLSELVLFRMFRPSDATLAVVGGLWVGMPYPVAAGFGVLLRRHRAVLIVLLVSLLLAGAAGLSVLHSAATHRAEAEEQARTAVLPGEDPDHGPAGMRKAGADMGVAVGGVFSIMAVAVVPPVQSLVVAGSALIGYTVSAVRRSAKAVPSQSPAGPSSGR